MGFRDELFSIQGMIDNIVRSGAKEIIVIKSNNQMRYQKWNGDICYLTVLPEEYEEAVRLAEEANRKIEARRALPEYKEEELSENLKAALDRFSQKESVNAHEQSKGNEPKRNLKNRFKNLKNKVYKLATKTREKAKKAKEFLQKNGKKAISLIASLGLAVGMAAYTIKTAQEGYDTFQEYGSAAKIEHELGKDMAEEYARSLNLRPGEYRYEINTTETDEVKITIIPDNDPSSKLSDVAGGLGSGSPHYLDVVARKYFVANRIKENGSTENGGKITIAIQQARAGNALKKAKKLLKNNDVIVTPSKFGFKHPKIKRIDERIIPQNGGEERG